MTFYSSQQRILQIQNTPATQTEVSIDLLRQGEYEWLLDKQKYIHMQISSRYFFESVLMTHEFT